jgi:hypothetical protein
MAMYNDTPYQNYVEQNFYLTLEMSPCVHAKRKAYLLLLGDRLQVAKARPPSCFANHFQIRSEVVAESGAV